MILDIDMGNTRIKWRRASIAGVAEDWRVLPGLWQSEWRGTQRVRLSSVADAATTTALVRAIERASGLTVEVASVRQGVAGVQLAYADVSRLGVDRWLSLLAVRQSVLVGGVRDALVINAGTAVTLDLLRADGRHLGGYIVPGIRNARRALASGTAHLPDGEWAAVHSRQPGATTLDCLDAGFALLYRGLLAQVAEVADGLLQTPGWWFSGGDAGLLAQCLPRALLSAEGPGHIWVGDGLVLDGLSVALP